MVWVSLHGLGGLGWYVKANNWLTFTRLCFARQYFQHLTSAVLVNFLIILGKLHAKINKVEH